MKYIFITDWKITEEKAPLRNFKFGHTTLGSPQHYTHTHTFMVHTIYNFLSPPL